MKKPLLIGAGVVIVGIITVIVLTVLNLGSLIKTVTETYGPQITQTEVKLEDADISILSGSGSLDGFLLGNPKGFSMPSAIKCDTIRVKVVTDSLTTDRIIIDEIYVDGPVISYEKKGNTDNFQTILNNIKKSIASETKESKDANSDTSDTGSNKTIQINNFIVKNGEINLGGSLLNSFGNEGVGIAMPDIHLKDIGKENETSPAEAFALIIKEMTGDVSGAVGEVGKQLKENLGKALDGVKGSTDSVGDAVKGLFGD